MSGYFFRECEINTETTGRLQKVALVQSRRADIYIYVCSGRDPTSCTEPCAEPHMTLIILHPACSIL